MLLALETSCRMASISLVISDGDLRQTRLAEGVSQGTNLIPLLRDFLEENDVKVGDISSLALNVGPGSATGLRMAVSLAQAMSLRRQDLVIHAVPIEEQALCALRHSEWDLDELTMILDAQGGQVFVQSFVRESEWQSKGDLEIMENETLKSWDEEMNVMKHREDRFEKRGWSEKWRWHELNFPSSEWVARVAQEGERFVTRIEELDVRYIKPSQAEINWRKK